MDKNRGLLQLENIGYVIDNKTILDKVQFDLSAGEFKLWVMLGWISRVLRSIYSYR